MLFLVICLSFAFSAWSQLAVHPKSIIMQKGTRTGEISYFNQSKERKTYEVGLKYRKVGENGFLGGFTSEATSERVALGLVRFSPRRFTLEPGASQTVRMMVTGTTKLEPLDYRGVIVAKTVQSFGTDSSKDKKTMRLQIKPNLSLGVPFMYYNGVPKVQAKLVDVKITKGQKGFIVSGTALNTGDFYPLGSIHVSIKKDKGFNHLKKLGSLNVLGKKRHFQFEIDNLEEQKGEYSLVYQTPNFMGSKVIDHIKLFPK